MNQRVNFKKMIQLAKMNEIDLILTKSISRFSRDVVDGITIIQDLRKHYVEVYFEKEQISSMDSSFDMILTILSSLAEEESKSNSNNVLWTYKKKMKEGLNTTPRLYGYIIKSGKYLINEKEASAIRLIYKLFLQGYKTSEIIDELAKHNYKTSRGKNRFSPSVIRAILRNEKYVGDMKLQKTTVTKIGSKTSKVNKIKPMYYVINNHEPIIDRNDFDNVQKIISERNKLYKPKADSRVSEHKYSNFVYSMVAGKYYKSKVNHRGKPYEVKLLELIDSQKNRVLEIKNIYYSQIDILIDEVLKCINKNIYEFKKKVASHFSKSQEISTLTSQLELIKSKLQINEEKEKAITSSSILNIAKQEMMAKLKNENDALNIELLNLKHQQIMSFNYENGLSLFLNQIKNIDNHNPKDLFFSIVSADRENLNLILKLSNKLDVDIDYHSILKTNPVYEGSYPFKQTRLELDVQWKLFLV